MIVTFIELRELINFYSRWNYMKTVGLEAKFGDVPLTPLTL